MMPALALLLGGVGQASADMLYDNGAISGNLDAQGISSPYTISDSFTLSSASVLTSAQIGLEVTPGTTPNTVSWEIGTTPFGSDVNSGTATLSNTPDGITGRGVYDIYVSTFSLPNVSLGAGTYYLTLENATATNGGYVYWDKNGGPSSAQVQYLYNGSLNTYSIDSESFQIEGSVNPIATPAPASLTLLGIGAVCLVGYGWRRRRKMAAA
jgi:hypothetical protein